MSASRHLVTPDVECNFSKSPWKYFMRIENKEIYSVNIWKHDSSFKKACTYNWAFVTPLIIITN